MPEALLGSGSRPVLSLAPHFFLSCRAIGDRMGEAKASGNLGNTLKVLGRFDEAIVCCQRHLDIAQEQGDKVGGWASRPPAFPTLALRTVSWSRFEQVLKYRSFNPAQLSPTGEKPGGPQVAPESTRSLRDRATSTSC
jgi:hypothetical protein